MEVDLLVAGAGAGGMTAALVGALEGLEVALCEKSGEVGGTSATSAGTLWIPCNAKSLRAGFEDSLQDARRYLDELVQTSERRELREAYLATGPQAIDYLEANTEVKFVAAGRHPDYREHAGFREAGRGIVAETFDARVLGADFARVRAPIEEYMLLGGMMVAKADIAPLLGRYRSAANFIHAMKLALRYAADRFSYPRGTRLTMGNALVGRLFHSLRRRGVPILFEAPIVELIQERGRVAGAVLRDDNNPSGKLREVRARRGVVLATGGFGHNPEMRLQLMSGPQAGQARSMAHRGNTGDGLGIARKLGAALAGKHTGGLWTPASITRRRDGSQGLYPHFLLDRAKPGVIAVDAAGRRFVNEGCSYHDFVEAMFAAGVNPAWLVCTQDFVRKYGLGAIYPGTRNLERFEREGYIVRARSLEALARRIAVDPAGLAATVRRYNAHAARGEDPDFHKGSTVLNRFNGDPAAPHPCLAPIERAPFVAQAVWPADISVSTGLATDVDARVLDASGSPIAGLYACGNDMASIFMGTYPGPGTTLGPAVTFGYRAARHAASKPSG